VFHGAAAPDGLELRVDGRVVWSSGALAPEVGPPALTHPYHGLPCTHHLPLPGAAPTRSRWPRRLRPVLAALLLAPALFGCLAVGARTLTAAPRYETRAVHDPDGTGRFYMGREIAQVMGHQAADWLDRPEREAEEAPTMLIQALKLRPGDRVGDVGAGSGYLTFRMARKVGPRGRVYAVDIQPEMLALIRQRGAKQGLRNVVPVLGTITDPKLPAGVLDLILMVDVYHELSHPWEMTRSMLRALKPGGRLVLVEYRAEDPNVPIKPVHKMTEAQVRKELGVHPARWVHTLDVLPRQHILVFRKSGTPTRTGPRP
jgi:ubiquinone/menaquinone biosynthesis C-methylase UbiE